MKYPIFQPTQTRVKIQNSVTNKTTKQHTHSKGTFFLFFRKDLVDRLQILHKTKKIPTFFSVTISLYRVLFQIKIHRASRISTWI